MCVARGWRFSLIGGIALQRWGEPRQTVDVDLTLLTGFGGEGPFIDTLLEHFEPRLTDARDFRSANPGYSSGWKLGVSNLSRSGPGETQMCRGRAGLEAKNAATSSRNGIAEPRGLQTTSSRRRSGVDSSGVQRSMTRASRSTIQYSSTLLAR